MPSILRICFSAKTVALINWRNSFSIIFDSEPSKFFDADIICHKVKVIAQHFKDLLLDKNCHIDHLKEQLQILFDHIKRCFKIFCRKMLANYFLHWWRFGNSQPVTHSRKISCCSVILCRVGEGPLTFTAYFFKGMSITETWQSRTSFTYKVRQRSEQRKIWRCCWNVFKRILRWYNQEKKVIYKVMCTHLIEHH